VGDYPIAVVNLQSARCVVVGGGEVAARKVAGLQIAGARPVVISPALNQTLWQQAESGEIETIQREYQPGDLAGARLVIAATDDPETNESVWQEAQAMGCLVNVVDDPERCNFHVPATIRRGALTVSVSTGGSSPLLSSRIRQALERQFDAAYEPYLALLADLRPIVSEQNPDPVQRKAIWEAILDSEILDLLRSNEPERAHKRAQKIIENYSR
jgi:precorrin-2 dehydrogenase/sirohydrochlorin ferrochelatase